MPRIEIIKVSWKNTITKRRESEWYISTIMDGEPITIGTNATTARSTIKKENMDSMGHHYEEGYRYDTWSKEIEL